jgi:hypothetical protein
MSTASAAPTPAVAAIPSASAPAASAALTLRPRFVHYERSSEKVLAVQSFNCLVCVRVVADLSKTEAARLPRKPIAKQGE